MFLHRRQHGWHSDDCFQLHPKSFRPQKKIHPHIGGSASPKNLSMVVVPIQKTCYLHRRCPSFRQIFLIGKPTFEHFQGFLRRSLDRLGANDDTGRVQHQPLSPCSLRYTVCPNNRPSRLLCVSKRNRHRLNFWLSSRENSCQGISRLLVPLWRNLTVRGKGVRFFVYKYASCVMDSPSEFLSSCFSSGLR